MMAKDIFCQGCKPGEYNTEDGSCEVCTENTIDSGCFVCDPLDTSKCLICQSGYYHNTEGKCLKEDTQPD